MMVGLSFTHAENNARNPGNQRVMLLGLIQSLHNDAGSAQQAARSLSRMGPDAAPAAGDLVQALAFDEDAVFEAVSDALVIIGAASLPPLKIVLGHPNFIVRRRAALILARFGPQARHAAPELVGLLTDPRGEVHDAAEKALLQMDEAAIPALTDGLKSAGSGTRDVLIITLGHFGSKAVPVLLERLQKDDNAYIRSRVAEALGQMPNAAPEVLIGLIQALSDLDENVRGAAADSLGDLKPAASAAIGPLIVISENDHDALTRKRAAETLGRIGPATRESLTGLIAAQRNSNANVRRQVLEVLVKSSLTWPDPLPVLLNAIRDPDAQVRLKGVQVSAALAKPGPDVLLIFRQAISDPAADIRCAAVTALGQWKEDSPAAAELSRALSDLNPVVRQRAIQSLGNLGMAGLPGLLQALSDGSSLLSAQAGDGIVLLGKDAIPALETMQKGPDPTMQKMSNNLLMRIARKSDRKKKKNRP